LGDGKSDAACRYLGTEGVAMHAPGGWGVRSLGVDFDVFKYLNPPTGTYTTTVTRGIHGDHQRDGITPGNGDQKTF
jgi:hypothetical protein